MLDAYLPAMSLGFFFRCAFCGQGVSFPSLPLCRHCLESLRPCPPLCPSCGSPACLSPRNTGGHCLRPWIRQAPLDSLSALYLLIEPGYGILKSWKKSRGFLFDRAVLKKAFRALSLDGFASRTGADAIVPVPQRFERAWKMGGSRTEILSRWLSGESGIPVRNLLKPAMSPVRQARLPIPLRLENRLDFSTREPSGKETLLRGRSVILVDDFMTTGHTLRRAAETLKSIGVEKVHAFCLGVRPIRWFESKIA